MISCFQNLLSNSTCTATTREAVHALGEAHLGVLDVVRRNKWLDGDWPGWESGKTLVVEEDAEKAAERAAERAKAEAASEAHLKGALDAFHKALAIAPGAAVTLAARAAACEATGDDDAAEAHYRAAAVATPWSSTSVTLSSAAAAAAAANLIRAVVRLFF
jgi:hypothetical protein